MAETLAPEHMVRRTRSHRLSLLHKFRHRKERKGMAPFPHPASPDLTPGSLSHCPSILGVRKAVPFVSIVEEYSHLHDAIVSHVRRFYSATSSRGAVSHAVVEHASTGMMIPWPQVRSLLGDSTSTLATLSLCITWTILSRSLLLKLGISNSPGSSFLPPEIVECFQSFSMGRAAVTLEMDEANSVNFGLLSRWKQISATLLHSTYTTYAFTHFDSRTVNIERALKDLDPLLSTYAVPQHHRHTISCCHTHTHAPGSQDPRLSDLRDLLKLGAQFAWTLFSQPSFWKFDWTSDRAIENGKEESQLSLGRVPSFDTAMKMEAKRDSGDGGNVSSGFVLEKAEIVIWPRLMRVMDGDGTRLEGDKEEEDGSVFGEKMYLDHFGRFAED
ncbi:hypothetical protein P280DRAFT_44268 [Massarina eburnea CBS 473.64]|uniref:Uncharacterized protein n=1 Tax=Massarina eburnea CBS 473.64 TaxID=1395130 RepID=A0A6A6RWW4_9PLEO|nr:hypothetical protein P280DRAFT_44268 [Massarina eburnea CBS 473.64]